MSDEKNSAQPENTAAPENTIPEAVTSSARQPMNSKSTPSSGDYNASMIKSLDDVEHVRTRPGMYIGGYNPRGLHHLVYEIVDNSIDEVLAGHATTSKSESIPMAVAPSPTMAAEFRSIFTPIPACPPSKWCFQPCHRRQIRTRRRQRLQNFRRASRRRSIRRQFRLRMARGRCQPQRQMSITWSSSAAAKSSELKIIGKSAKTGTVVSFKPDPTLFTDVNFVHETLAQRLRELAYLNKGVEIIFIDERVNKQRDL